MTQALAQALSAENIPQTDAEEGIGQVYRGAWLISDR